MIEHFKKNKRIGTLMTIVIAIFMLTSLTGCNSTTNTSPSDDAAGETYYGQWTITNVPVYGAAGTYSKEDAEKLIGKNLSFSADEATVFTDQPSDTATVIKDPSYKIDTISGSDFLTNFNMSLEKLGIGADSVTEVNISGPDGGAYLLLIKDSDTMILATGGTYFELARENRE